MEEHVVEKVCAEGSVTFISRPATMFRYRIAMKGDDTVYFWLEDTETKHQWRSDDLSDKDLALFNNVAVAATLADYVSIFENCLKKPLSDPTTDAQCRLVPDYGGAFALEFVLQLRMYIAVWSAKFRFVLKPVPLEPIQIAEAVIRDLREELVQTRYLLNSTVDHTQHSKPLFLKCDLSDSDGTTTRSSSNSGGSSVVVWKRASEVSDGGDGNYTEDANGTIRIHRAGKYWINAALYHDEREAGAKHFALKLKQSSSGHAKRTAKEFPIECFGSCSTQSCLIVATQDQEVTVVRTTKVVVLGEGSSLVIVPMR